MRIIREFSSVRFVLLVGLLGIALGADSSKQLAANDTVLPEPTRRGLEHIAELKTFSASWSQYQRPGEVTRAKLGLPPVDPQAFSHLTSCYLVWQDSKMYWRNHRGEGEWQDAGVTHRQEIAFDGRTLARGTPNRHSPSVVYDHADKLGPNGHYFPVIDFERLGIRLPHGPKEFLSAKHLTSQILFLLDHGGVLHSIEPSEIDGDPVIRIAVYAENQDWQIAQDLDLVALESMLRQTGKKSDQEIREYMAGIRRANELMPRELDYAYYLDPALGCAVRRFQELTNDGRLRVQSDCTKHQKLSGTEVWLAKNCVTAFYCSDGHYPGQIFDAPLVTQVMEVSEFSTTRVPEELFTLRYTTPGTDVIDGTLPGSESGERVNYRVPANPNDLDHAIEEARKSSLGGSNRWKGQKGIRIVLIAGNAIALVGLLVYLVIRHRRNT